MLEPRVHNQIKQLQLRTRRLVDGQFAGEYLSIFQGRGTEFAEVREYEPGDDVRTIDWKVTARTGVPFVKQYIEERELTVMLVADMSGSTAVGSTERTKRETIAEVCAVIGLNAIRHNNKVGIAVFADDVIDYLSPSKDKNQMWRVLARLVAGQLKGRTTNLGAALYAVRQRLRQRALCVIVSDFLATDFERPFRGVVQRHDVVPVCVDDPTDREIPITGLVHLEDLESGAIVLVDGADDSFQHHYRESRSEAELARRRIFQNLGVNPIMVSTDRPYIVPIKRYFQSRGQGR